MAHARWAWMPCSLADHWVFQDLMSFSILVSAFSKSFCFFSCSIRHVSLAGTSRVLHHCLFILGSTSSSSSSSKSSLIAMSSSTSDSYPGHTAVIRLGDAGRSGMLALVPLLPSALGSYILGRAALAKFLMNWAEALLIKVSKKVIYSEVFTDLCLKILFFSSASLAFFLSSCSFLLDSPVYPRLWLDSAFLHSLSLTFLIRTPKASGCSASLILSRNLTSHSICLSRLSMQSSLSISNIRSSDLYPSSAPSGSEEWSGETGPSWCKGEFLSEYTCWSWPSDSASSKDESVGDSGGVVGVEDGADEPVGEVNPDGHLGAWTLCRLNWSCLCHFEGLTMCR